ncbi:MAG: hypothetical protein K2G55_08060 [Lachnospiraceae bacterium]|nr:hypothetical protein [Lachnospiraceae bacterium]
MKDYLIKSHIMIIFASIWDIRQGNVTTKETLGDRGKRPKYRDGER